MHVDEGVLETTAQTADTRVVLLAVLAEAGTADLLAVRTPVEPSAGNARLIRVRTAAGPAQVLLGCAPAQSAADVTEVPAETGTDDAEWTVEPADASAADETVWLGDLFDGGLDDVVDGSVEDHVAAHPSSSDPSTAARVAEEVRRRWARRRARVPSN